MSATIAGGVPQALAMIAGVLNQKGYEISDSSASAGWLITAPKYTWPLDSEKQDWHGAESPGVVLSIRLMRAGDSTRVEISGRSPVKPGWKDEDVASTLEMLSVFEIAAALPDSKKP